eukprot:scaffold87586_cov32-Tisochrysis_lutea.AAC.2
MSLSRELVSERQISSRSTPRLVRLIADATALRYLSDAPACSAECVDRWMSRAARWYATHSRSSRSDATLFMPSMSIVTSGFRATSERIPTHSLATVRMGDGRLTCTRE